MIQIAPAKIRAIACTRLKIHQRKSARKHRRKHRDIMRTLYKFDFPDAPSARLITHIYPRSNQAELILLQVPPKYRGQGYASRLLKMCITDADASKLQLGLIICPSGGLDYGQLHAFYTRYGFAREDRHFYIRYPKF